MTSAKKKREVGGKTMEVKLEPVEDSADQYDRAQLPDLLRVYYTWLFPYDKYFDWLYYGTVGVCLS